MKVFVWLLMHLIKLFISILTYFVTFHKNKISDMIERISHYICTKFY